MEGREIRGKFEKNAWKLLSTFEDKCGKADGKEEKLS